MGVYYSGEYITKSTVNTLRNIALFLKLLEKVSEIERLVKAACVNVRKMEVSNHPELDKFSMKTFSCESFMKFYNAAFIHKMIAYKRKDSGHCIPKFCFSGDSVMSKCYCIDLSIHFSEIRTSWLDIIPRGTGSASSSSRRIEDRGNQIASS